MRIQFICSLILTSLIITVHAQDSDREVGLFTHNREKVAEGYILFAPKHNTMTYLINNEGRIIHEWTNCTYEPGQSVYLMENGNLLRCCFSKNHVFGGGGDGGRIEEYDWDDNLVWSMEINTGDKNNPSGAKMMHHDVEVLPNGNILAIVWEYKTLAECLQAGRDPNKMDAEYLWPDYIAEIKKTGTSGGDIIWEWHVWDHLIQDFDQTKENYGVISEHPELIDINFWAETGHPYRANWNHMNSIDYNPELDQIMLSVRGFSEIWIIDHSTSTAEAAGHTGGRSGKGGDLLYRWGNPRAYGAGSAQDQILFQGHDPQWIESGLPGAGDIIMFNNGPELGFSTVVVWDIPQTDENGNYPLESGNAYGPDNAYWIYNPEREYQDWKFFSAEISGAQRLPNGNTLICSGTKGFFSEITEDQEVVWEYICPVGQDGPLAYNEEPPLDDRGHGMNGVFKIHRYASNFPAFTGKNLVPGDLIETYPNAIENEQSVVPDRFELFQNYPNPFNPKTVISYQLSGFSEVELTIFNIFGQEVKTLVDEQQSYGLHEVSWNGTNNFGFAVGSGVYLYKLQVGNNIEIKKMMLIR